MKKQMKKGIVMSILSLIAGGIIGAAGANVLTQKLIIDNKQKADKYRKYYNTLIHMFAYKHSGKKIEQYFIDKGYKVIAIYGMGEMGRCLYEELKNTSIIVKYAIDRDAVCMNEEIKVVEQTDTLEMVDVIVVSAVFAYNDIECELGTLIDVPIISLDDILVNSSEK